MNETPSQVAFFERVRVCELAHQVCDIEVEGVPVWDLIRFEVCLEQLMVDVGIGTPRRMAATSGRGRRMWRRCKKLWHNWRLDVAPLRGQPMVFGSGRRKKEADGCWWDPVWDPVAAALPSLRCICR